MADTGGKSEGGLWTRLPIVLSAVNPVLLVFIGYILNSNIEQAKLEIQRNSAHVVDLKTAAETSSITARTRVDKVKVISDFINDLTGPDERRRRLALEAVFIALPDEAARLVKAVERLETGDKVTAKDVTAAKNALDYTRSRLVTEMFSEDRATRVDALHTLQRGWGDDGMVMSQLIDRAMQDVEVRKASGWAMPATPPSQQVASLSNVMEFLSAARVPSDEKLKSRIREFAEAAKSNSNDTQRFAKTVRERFQ